MIVVLIIGFAVYADVLRRRRAGYLREVPIFALEEKISRHMRDSTRRRISKYEKEMNDFRNALRKSIERRRQFESSKSIQKQEDRLRSIERDQAKKVSSDMADAAQWSRRCDYFADLRRKYERAARSPWLTVSSDPPEPARPEHPLDPIPPGAPNTPLLPAPPEPPPPGPHSSSQD
jgi:hypothetical protein